MEKNKKTVTIFNDKTVNSRDVIIIISNMLHRDYYRIKLNIMSNRKIGPYQSFRMYMSDLNMSDKRSNFIPIGYKSVLATKCSTSHISDGVRYTISSEDYGIR